jgi:L-aspartate oxidase
MVDRCPPYGTDNDPPSGRYVVAPAARAGGVEAGVADAITVIAALPAVRARWRRDADVVVVGSGAAGISAALSAAASGLRVLMLTKDLIGGATPLAQGGLAAAIGPGDSAAAHVGDTLVAGAGLCESEVVTALAAGAPGAIEWLTGLGANLETRELRLEGGHSKRRIVHSGDDATGAEVHRVLLAALLSSGIEILDRAVAIDLTRSDSDQIRLGNRLTEPIGAGDGRRAPLALKVRPPMTGQTFSANDSELVAGLVAATIGPDGRLAAGVISARAVVVAAGGLGQAFDTTSNPSGATGDGIALAARAGAVLRDLEFVQFHPTVLWLPGASGQCPLITEALRGAGAVLRDLDGTPLMTGHDPRGDLAPRDVVAARMAEVIAAGTAGHVWLDATGLGRNALENGFPTVTAACRKHGIDPVTEYIPVAPGAHYSCGGIRADLDGRTSIPGLYAVGEAASTGVQGANRLASNSVTEAIIAGRRAGDAVGTDMPDRRDCPSEITFPAGSAPVSQVRVWARSCRPKSALGTLEGRKVAVGSVTAGGGNVAEGRRGLAAAMSRYAGVLRDAEGLALLAAVISGADVADGESGGTVLEKGEGLESLEGLEAANLRTVSALITAGALRRAESRGCHRRRDAAMAAERPWHTLMRWDGQELVMTEEEL